MKFEIFKSKRNGQVYFRLKSGNGKVVLESEGYKHRKSAMKAIRAIQRSATAKIVIVEK